jgi:hypothetical protein
MTPSHWQNCRVTRNSALSGPPNGEPRNKKTLRHKQLWGNARHASDPPASQASWPFARRPSLACAVLSAHVRPSPNGGWLPPSDDQPTSLERVARKEKTCCASLVSTSPSCFALTADIFAASVI